MTETTGMRIKRERTHRLLSQQELAEALDISQVSLSLYERDERTPRDAVKVRMARFFGTTVQDLFFPTN